MFKRLHNSAGMSIIEIMIAIAIMALVASLVSTKVTKYFKESKVQAAKLQMKNFETALQDYYRDNGQYPTTEQGLEALVAKPTTGPEPQNYSPEGYLAAKQVPKDPWTNSYLYFCEDGSKFRIITYGEDRKEGGTGFAKDLIQENE